MGRAVAFLRCYSCRLDAAIRARRKALGQGAISLKCPQGSCFSSVPTVSPLRRPHASDHALARLGPGERLRLPAGWVAAGLI
jgi:hypothetical protein